MKRLAMDQFYFPEQMAQEEHGDCRRSKIKTLANSIRDWWNHCCEPTPTDRDLEERINESRIKYGRYRILL